MLTRVFVIQLKLSYPVRVTSALTQFPRMFEVGDVIGHEGFFDVTEAPTHEAAQLTACDFVHDLFAHAEVDESLREYWPEETADRITADIRILERFVFVPSVKG